MLKCANMLHFIKSKCENRVKFIDSSGFVYCTECAAIRNKNKSCIKLSMKNIDKLNQGETLTRYELGK